MQALCSQCSTRIQIDDARVPDRPFKVRCPKCQTVLTLPGRDGTEPVPGTPSATPETPAASAPATEPSAGAAGPVASIAEAPTPPPDVPGPAEIARLDNAAKGDNDAIVALSGPAAPVLRQALSRLGYNVDLVDDIEEGARLLEQGVYEVAVTTRAPLEAGKPETLAQRILRLPADSRRRVFVMLVGDEFRTGDGTQAWAAQADLVLNPKDVQASEHFLRSAMSERRRLYQPFNDARRKIEGD